MNQANEPHTTGWQKELLVAREVPRCGARTRSGLPCRGAAMANGRCPMHTRGFGAEPASKLEARPEICPSHGTPQGGGRRRARYPAPPPADVDSIAPAPAVPTPSLHFTFAHRNSTHSDRLGRISTELGHRADCHGESFDRLVVTRGDIGAVIPSSRSCWCIPATISDPLRPRPFCWRGYRISDVAIRRR